MGVPDTEAPPDSDAVGDAVCDGVTEGVPDLLGVWESVPVPV